MRCNYENEETYVPNCEFHACRRYADGNRL